MGLAAAAWRLNVEMMRYAAILALLTLVAIPAGAQQLLGRVFLPDSSTPAAGAVLEAALDGDSSVRVRTLSSGTGDFLLVLPRPGTYALTGLRIGYAPTDLGRLTLGANERRTARFTLGNAPVRLQVVRVDARAQCGREVQGGSTVASLLTQVRTALGAATLTSTDGRAEAEWRSYRLIVDHRNVPLAGPWDSVRTGATQRPFASVSVFQLSNEGFVRFVDDGAEYRAPDAEVLLSEWFVSTHCFAVVEDDARPELIGLRFTPATVRRNLIDIRGTLWLTREGTALQMMDFGYVGLPRYLEVANPGGSLAFARLSDGAWIVRAWELRMPRAVRSFLIARASEGEREVPQVVASTEYIGAQVAAVRRGDATLFSGSVESLAQRFPAIGTPSARPSCPAALAYDRDTQGLVYGEIRTAHGSLPRSTRAEISWMAPPHPSLPQSERRQIRLLDAPDGFFMLCGMPFGSGISVKALAPGYVQGEESLRLGTRTPTARLQFVLEPAPTVP